jgi:hypothetical protein
VDGPEAMRRLDTVVRTVFGISNQEILKREAEYRKQAKLNPNKRGPKPKPTR